MSRGAHERHHGTCGIDGTDDGERQVLHAEIAEQPTGEHEATLCQDIAVQLPSATGHMEQRAVERRRVAGKEDERQEKQRTEESVEKEDRDNRIVPQRNLLKSIITS